MALSFGGLQANMGPFKPVSLKGNAFVNGVPMFVNKLPMTLGGVAGENVKFGRVCSVDPTDRRHFVRQYRKRYFDARPFNYVARPRPGRRW